MGLINTVLTWLKKGEKLQGTDISTPNDPNGILNRPLNELLQNDVDLESRITAVESNSGGGTITSINGNTGPIVVLNNNDVGAAAISHNHTVYDNYESRIGNLEAAPIPLSGFSSIARYAMGGTFLVPPGKTSIEVTVVGGGGSGGGIGGNGGGGGGTAVAIVSVVPGDAVTIIVGSGGTGGGNGGNSIVTIISQPGGDIVGYGGYGGIIVGAGWSIVGAGGGVTASISGLSGNTMFINGGHGVGPSHTEGGSSFMGNGGFSTNAPGSGGGSAVGAGGNGVVYVKY